MSANVALDGPAQARLHLEAVLAEAVVSRAAAAARTGDFHAAAALLETLPETPRTLDLRARIAVQRGELLEGERLWRQSLVLRPDSPECRAALRRIENIKRRTASGALYRFRSAMPAAILVLVCLAALYGANAWTIRFRASLLQDLRTQIAQPAPAAGPTPLVEAFAIPGLRSESHPDGLRLVFEEGAFSAGTTLTPAARTSLAEFARQLSAHRGSFRVVVVGYADSEPVPAKSRFIDNEALSLSRAAVVVRVIRQSAELPAEIFSAQGFGHSGAPYASLSRMDMRKNRTVVLWVTPFRQ